MAIGIADCNFGDTNSEATSHQVDEHNDDGENQHISSVLADQIERVLDGVDWFVVDRSTTDRTSWEPFATVRYSNDTFFVLELNKI